MRRLLSMALLAAAGLALQGCLLLGGANVGAGVVHAGEASAWVVLERSYATVFGAVQDEFRWRGGLDEAEAETGSVRGRIGDDPATVTVLRETETTVRVTVDAADAEAAVQFARKVARRVKS